MTDYSEQGAVPVEDGALDPEDLPTVDDVIDAQRRHHPEQAETAVHGEPPGAFEPEGPGRDRSPDDE